MNLHEFLIVCPLVFLAGFVDAIAGGGGLISLPAYMFAGIPVHHAIATNKLSSRHLIYLLYPVKRYAIIMSSCFTKLFLRYEEAKTI